MSVHYQQAERWCWTSWMRSAARSLPRNGWHPCGSGELGEPSGTDWKVSTWHPFEKIWCAACWLINFCLKCFSHLNLHGCRQQMGRWRGRGRRVNLNTGAPSAATKAQQMGKSLWSFDCYYYIGEIKCWEIQKQALFFPFLATVFLLLFLHQLSSVMIVSKACFTMWKVF